MMVGASSAPTRATPRIIIEMDRSSTDPLEEIRLDPEGGDALENLYPQVTFAAIEEILARPEYEGIEFYHSGDVPLNDAYNTIIGGESMLLSLLTLAMITVIFFAVLPFGSERRRARPGREAERDRLHGLIGLLGWSLDMSFGSVPTLLTAIGVAHSVHILSEFRARFTRAGRPARGAGPDPLPRGNALPADEPHHGGGLRLDELRADQEHRPHGGLQRVRRDDGLRPLAHAADGAALLRAARAAPRGQRAGLGSTPRAAATSTPR